MSNLTTQEKGKLPAQPHANPSRQVLVTDGSYSTSPSQEQVQSVTTLRSEKVIDKTIIPKDRTGREVNEKMSNDSLDRTKEEDDPKDPMGRKIEAQEDELPSQTTMGSTSKVKMNENVGSDALHGEKEPTNDEGKDVQDDYNILKYAPFPHRLIKPKPHNLSSELFETFKQVKINLPLLDAIKQIPSYAKFLKELCTFKWKLNVKEKSFLA